MKLKRCSQCLKTKRMSPKFFWRKTSSSDGFAPYCKDCVSTPEYKARHLKDQHIYLKTDKGRDYFKRRKAKRLSEKSRNADDY